MNNMKQTINEVAVASDNKLSACLPAKKKDAEKRVKRDDLYTQFMKIVSPHLPKMPAMQAPGFLNPISTALDSYFGCTQRGYLTKFNA